MMKTTTEKNLYAVIEDFAIYNLWANQKLVHWLSAKPQDLMFREVPSSFSSIKETLLHIWDVERSWLGHLEQQPIASFRWNGFEGTYKDITEGIIKTSQEILDHVRAASYNFSRPCHFDIQYVGEHTIPSFEVLLHTMNHSTYHRGQLVTIGRNVGLTDAPMTDYMFYVLRERNPVREKEMVE